MTRFDHTAVGFPPSWCVCPSADDPCRHLDLPSGADVSVAGGDVVGTVAFVLVDDRPGRPAFVAVQPAPWLLRDVLVLVPRSDVHRGVEGTCLDFSVEMFLDAPRIPIEVESLDPDEEEGLLSYYDLSRPPAAVSAGHLTVWRSDGRGSAAARRNATGSGSCSWS